MNVTLTPTHLDVHLETWEKIVGLSGDHHVPRERIAGAEVEPEPLRAVRFKLAAGLRVPGVRYLAWTRTPPAYWAVHRGVPALRVHLRGGRLRQLIVSTPDAERLAHELRA